DVAPARIGLPLWQLRSRHRPGGVVRPARQDREGRCRRRRHAAAIPGAQAPTPSAGAPAGAALWRQVPRGRRTRGQAMTSLPERSSPKRLGLVIDLDICVGCHACAVNCKQWNSGGVAAPLTDLEPYDADPDGVWFNRVHTYEVGEG